MSVTIASLFPIDKTVERPRRRPVEFSRIFFPGVPKGNPPFLFVVPQTHEMVRMVGQPDPLLAQPSYITAEDFAQDIVMEFTQRQPFFEPGSATARPAQPAVWICAGDKPTQEEIDKYTRLQLAWIDRVIAQTDEAYRRAKGNIIPDSVRSLLAYIGKTTEWSSPLLTQRRNCPFCGTDNIGDYPICVNCKNVMDPVKFQALQEHGKINMPPAKPLPQLEKAAR